MIFTFCNYLFPLYERRGKYYLDFKNPIWLMDGKRGIVRITSVTRKPIPTLLCLLGSYITAKLRLLGSYITAYLWLLRSYITAYLCLLGSYITAYLCLLGSYITAYLCLLGSYITAKLGLLWVLKGLTMLHV